MWIFEQHNLQISLNQLIRFNEYSSLGGLNFIVQISSEHAVAHWIFTNNESNFAQLTFQWWMSAAHSAFKQSVQNVYQLQQHRFRPAAARRLTAEPVSSTANRLQRSQATVFVRIICSYRFYPKSLLAKRLNMHCVFITQFTHHKTNAK